MRTFDCHETELMDLPQPVSSELEETLRNLEWLNQHLGGHRYALWFLDEHLKGARRLRILDLATGGGDFPRAMVDWGHRNDINVEVDAIDQSTAIIDLAEQFSVDYPEISFMQDDALSYASEQRYDLVHSSLSLHHFSTSEAVSLLRRCAGLSRQFVLITDLERTLFTRLGIRFANFVLQHNEMTVRDGDTSARRAFSFAELRAIAKGAGWKRFGHERFLWCRQAIWMHCCDRPAGA